MVTADIVNILIDKLMRASQYSLVFNPAAPKTIDNPARGKPTVK